MLDGRASAKTEVYSVDHLHGMEPLFSDIYAAVDQGDVDGGFERRRVRAFGLAAGPQGAGRTDELDAGADAHGVPGEPV
ncbi:MAG: hypothetical protein IH590_13760, partial [Aquamicrobium sp.]|nr:hypothetical protein [Aquamicrobium sp.]